MDLVFEIRNADGAVDEFWESVANDPDVDLAGFNLNAQDQDGETILHTAANLPLAGRQLKPLLTHFSNFDPFLRDSSGETFLHAFISRDVSEDKDLGRILLTGQLRYCGASVVKKLLGMKNNYGETPLHTYIKTVTQRKGPGGVHFELYPFAEAGADLNALDTIRETALHYTLHYLFLQKVEDDSDNESNASEEASEPSSQDIDDDCNSTEDQDTQHTQDVVSNEGDSDNESTRQDYNKCLEEDFADIIEPWKENFKYLVLNGANINAVNAYGETPLFLADITDMAEALIYQGADPSVLNSHMQSPLLWRICKFGVPPERFVKLFLDKGADINSVDSLGNTALHYAAWNGASEDEIKCMLTYGAKAVKDQQGKYPCDVAEFRRHIYMLDYLCSFKDHQHKRHFCGTGSIIKSEKFDNKQADVKSQLHQILGNLSVFDLVAYPGLGGVDFEGEARDIKAEVYDFVTELSNSVAEKSPYLRNTLFQSGSVGENTKTGAPDEFDFVFILDEISDNFEIDEEKSREDPSYVFLKKKCVASVGEESRFVDEDGYMDVYSVRTLLEEIVSDRFEQQTIFKSRLKHIHRGRESIPTMPTINFRLRWIGAVYKNLEIDIDFVPACRIRGWWPDSTNLDNLDCDVDAARNEGALLLIQDTTFPTSILDTSRKPACRVSALRVEKAHMAALPALPKKAYIACKVLCSKYVCPSLDTVCTVSTRDIITSYMLKSCMFHVYQAYKQQNRTSELEPLDAKSEERVLHEFVVQIFQTFLQCATEKKLHSFVLPWQNVFTFTTEHFKALKKLHKVYRMTFAKMILNILGEEHGFDDVDRKMWFNKSTDEFSDGYTDDGEEDGYFTSKRTKRFEYIEDEDSV